MDVAKRRIIDLFFNNVKGKTPAVTGNARHDGAQGHWLEGAMGVAPNASNTPDLYGYEMKNDTSTSGKTTFGDWSADYYLYKDHTLGIDRNQFIQIFGTPNPEKNNRYSWSGTVFPKVGRVNFYGQTMIVDRRNNIIINYHYSQDNRLDKSTIVPANLQRDDLVLAFWDEVSIRGKLEAKFDQKGWFKCVLNNQRVYDSIVFGDPISFVNWIGLVKQGVVYLDSGMHQGNSRNYSSWRASNTFWNSLIIDRY